MSGAQGGAARCTHIVPSDLARVATVDARFQSYNVEMVEVTGGDFWKPYRSESHPLPVSTPTSEGETPGGTGLDLFAYREPIDLTDRRLRALAAALGPAFIRVSGTWANRTYFPDSAAVPAATPPGFTGVLTHGEWKGVVEFAGASDAAILTSFATSSGTRDAAGAWNEEQARRFIDYTAAVGGHIAAAEFMNEPNLAALGGAPAGYDAAAYGRDFRRFHAFARKAAPGMLILGPGSVGETASGQGIAEGGVPLLRTRDLLAASGPGVDAFSYHHYGALSRRCAALGHQTAPGDALTEAWLARTDDTLAFYRAVRDEMEPGKSLWLTETAEAACGGNWWAGTFLDTFRYLDQLGRLARQGVTVVMHNTLVASDYGLLQEHTFTPKPNYWGALLWRRLMGTTVLDPGAPLEPTLHAYAHSLRGVPGGVALLVINTDRVKAGSLWIAAPSERYTLSAHGGDLLVTAVRLNGRELRLAESDRLPALASLPAPAGVLSFAPATITFLAIPDAGNTAAR